MTKEQFLDQEFQDIADLRLRILLENTKNNILLEAAISGMDLEFNKRQLEATKEYWNAIPEDIKERIEIAKTPRFVVTYFRDGIEQREDVSIPTSEIYKEGIESFIDALKATPEDTKIYLYVLSLERYYNNIDDKEIKEAPQARCVFSNIPNKKVKIYLANALFSEAELAYNDSLINLLETEYDVYAPQRNMSINDKSKTADSLMIYRGDKAELDDSDVLVAVLDGVVVDPGVAAEIGYFAAKGKTIIGLFTDSREGSKTVNAGKIGLLNAPLESQFPYVNLFVVGAIKENGIICRSTEELKQQLGI